MKINETESRAGAIAEASRVAPLLGAALRRRARLTLAEIARDVGVTENAVGNWERGACRPSRGDHAARYLALLRELDRLYGEPGPWPS